MDDLHELAQLIKQRNAVASEIAALIERPAQIGHVGEYVASRIFHIELQESASQKGMDGHFLEGPLVGRSVNIKWYAKQESMLAINPEALPDFYLVLAGPKTAAMSSRGQTRPWIVSSVHLFDAQELVDVLRERGIIFSVATSVRQHLWDEAELYPNQRTHFLQLTDDQRQLLALFQ